MTIKPTQSVERTLILAKLEVTKTVDPLPTKTADAFLVGAADITLNPTVLQRDIYRPTFSPLPGSVGRKVVTVKFNHEIKGSGANGVRPKLGTLLKGSGFKETLITAGAATQITTPIVEGTIVGPDVTFDKTTAPDDLYGSYLVTVVTGGASATAAVQVTKWAQGEYDGSVGLNRRLEVRYDYSGTTTLTLDDTDLTTPTITVGGVFLVGQHVYAVVLGEVFALTITSGMTNVAGVATALAALIDADARFTAAAVGAVITIGFAGNAAAVVLTSGTTGIDLGDSGAVITPTWTGNLVEGQQWIVILHETGYEYTPLSDPLQQGSLTIYMYKDGNLHIVTGCQGSVTFTGDAGAYGQAQFEFTGNYLDPKVEPLPTGCVYELSNPHQLELAEMSMRGDKDFCAQSFTINMQNTINPRDCMNGVEGLNGSNITGRQPTAQLNPESSIEVYANMWGAFAAGETLPLHLRVGTVKNNVVRFFAERASFTGLQYGDRNGTVTIEPSFQLNGVSNDGDDELRVCFPQSA